MIPWMPGLSKNKPGISPVRAQVFLKYQLLEFSQLFESPRLFNSFELLNGGEVNSMIVYSVLSYQNLDELTNEVNRKTAEGWRPQGGMAILPGELGYIFLQGMVREELIGPISAMIGSGYTSADDFSRPARPD